MIRPFFLLRRSWKTWTWDWRYYGLCTFANSSVMERGRVSGFVEERVARLYCCFRSNFKPQKGLCRWVKGFMSQCGANVFFCLTNYIKKSFRHCALYTLQFFAISWVRQKRKIRSDERSSHSWNENAPSALFLMLKPLSSENDENRYHESQNT